MEWREETVHVLVALHPAEEQNQFEAAIRDAVGLAVDRARRKGYEEGLEEGKRRAVDWSATEARRLAAC